MLPWRRECNRQNITAMSFQPVPFSLCFQVPDDNSVICRTYHELSQPCTWCQQFPWRRKCYCVDIMRMSCRLSQFVSTPYIPHSYAHILRTLIRMLKIPEAIKFPHGENFTEVTASLWPFNYWISFPDFKLQILIDLSVEPSYFNLLPETKNYPQGEQSKA